MTQQQFIEALLEAAKAAGLQEAEVYCLRNETARMMMGPGVIDQYSVNQTGGASLRGLHKGKMGAAYTEAMDEAAIPMLVSNVLQSAELIEDEQFIFTGSPRYETVDCTGDPVTPEEQINFALAMENAGRTLDPRVTQLSPFTQLVSTRQTTRVVSTHGLNLSHTQDRCVALVDAIAREGERVATACAFGSGTSLSDLSGEGIAEEAVREAVFRLSASPCESGEMAVIIRNIAMADLLSVFSSAFSADVAQKGLSLLAGKEGQQIAAPCVTLTDDPWLLGGAATSPFDAEGVATRRTRVIDEGVLTTLLHNLKTAKKAGVESTGNASRSGISAPVSVEPSNFYIAPGDLSLEQLEAEMQSGLVVTDVDGLHAGADAVSGDFSLLCRGYLVEQGKKARPVEQVTIAGNFFTLLFQILSVGNDLRFGMDGRIGCPSLRVKALSVAGK